MAVDIQKALALLAQVQAQVTEPKTKELLGSVQADVRAFLQDQQDQQNKLSDALNQSQAALTAQSGKVAELQGQNAALATQVESLKKQLAGGGGGGGTQGTPLDLASSFKRVIDSIQAEARNTPGVATTIKSMDIELKGLVTVQPDKTTVMVLPTERSSIDPGSLSTLRVSFGAIPVAGSPAPAPPRTPAPTPAPTSTPAPAPAPAPAKFDGTPGRRARRPSKT